MILVSPFSALSSALSKFHDLSFTIFCSLFSSFQVSLTLSKLLGNLFILGISIFCLCSGLFEFFFQRLHPLLIFLTFVGQDLAHTFRVITSSGSLVKLGNSNNKFFLILFQILLKLLDSSVQSIDLSLSSQQRLLLLLQLHGDDGKPL